MGAMQASPQEQRRADKAVIVNDESRRADAQRHLDARQQRLEAYAASLELALASHPGTARSAVLEDKLAQARRDIRAASRPRLPRARVAGAAGGGQGQDATL